MAIAAHGKTVEISMSGHKIVVKLSEKLLTIEMPTPGSGTMLFEVKLYDTNGKLLATGSQTVSLFNVTRIDIPLNWIEKNPKYGIERYTSWSSLYGMQHCRIQSMELKAITISPASSLIIAVESNKWN